MVSTLESHIAHVLNILNHIRRKHLKTPSQVEIFDKFVEDLWEEMKGW